MRAGVRRPKAAARALASASEPRAGRSFWMAATCSGRVEGLVEGGAAALAVAAGDGGDGFEGGEERLVGAGLVAVFVDALLGL